MRVSRSHTHTFSESVCRHVLGYHYYRCRACDWRGKAKSQKKRAEAKPGVLKTLLINAVFVLIGLVVVMIYIQKNS